MDGEEDKEYNKLAEPYRKDLDFAFFVVNFGYSPSDYEALTPRQKAFIYKAWEDKTVSDTTQIYNAVFTAFYNVNRGKNKRALKLWKKRAVQNADMDIVNENMDVIHEIEKAEGKGWIDRVYAANGIPSPRKEV